MSMLSVELTTGPLTIEIAPLLAVSNDTAILGILNRKDIPGKKPITSHDIKAFFSVSGFMIPIMDSTALSCRETILNLNLFTSFDVRNPAYLAKLTSILQGLVDEPLIPDFQQPHMDYVLSLGNTIKSRIDIINDELELTAQVNKTEFIPFSPTENDIAVARMEING